MSIEAKPRPADLLIVAALPDFRWLFVEALVLLIPEFRFFRPALADTLYPHGAPLARQRAQRGRALLHLTLAIKQLSQDSLSFAGFVGAVGGSGRDCMDEG